MSTRLQDELNSAIAGEDVLAIIHLLSVGGSPNEPDWKGWTPLMQAAEGENVEIIKLLLANSADILKKGAEGWTALHIAVDMSIDGTIQNDGGPGEEPTEVIALLLANGADVWAKNNKGQTAVDIAKGYCSEKIIRFLELNGKAGEFLTQES